MRGQPLASKLMSVALAALIACGTLPTVALADTAPAESEDAIVEEDAGQPDAEGLAADDFPEGAVSPGKAGAPLGEGEPLNALAPMATTSDLLNDDIWLRQQSSGECTLTAMAMMLRRAAILNGNSGWRSISESSVRSAAWVEGVGLRWSFSYGGMSVALGEFDGCSSESKLVGLLARHPEGIVIYTYAHSVLLTDYSDGVLYCADPTYGDRRPLSRASDGVRANNITQYWYVSSSVAAPEDGAVEPDAPVTAGWVKAGARWWYRYADGGYPASRFEEIDGAVYYFDADGWMVTGWKLIDGTWYRFRSSGALLTGWTKSGSSWYYLDRSSGAMTTGWVRDADHWYLMSEDGAMLTGWQRLGDAWYYLDPSNGAMATGWRKVAGTWYLLKQSGAMATGWQKVGGAWYYLRPSGAMATGWVLVDGSWYWLSPSGSMGANRWVGDYYLGKSGAMLVSTVTPDGYAVDGTGRWDRTVPRAASR